MVKNNRPAGLPKRSRDFTGDTFGKLTVVSFAGLRPPSTGYSHNTAHWLCRCECGNQLVLPINRLQTGNTRSCGCARVRHGKYRTGTGASQHPEVRCWKAMIARCTDKTSDKYEYYGGRGVKVCDRWMNFWSFLEDMGSRPSSDHSIDRYPDTRGNYEPGNCRWATRREQAENRTVNRLITHDGRTQPVSAWSIETGLCHATITARLDRGWSAADALTKPVAQWTTITHDGKTMTIIQWAKQVGLSQNCIRTRLKKGWSVSDAIMTPSSRRKRDED